MEKQKKLREYSLLLIFLTVLYAFRFVATTITQIIDGSLKEALNVVNLPYEAAVIIACIIEVIMIAFPLFIGLKGSKVSKNPNADKGYITAAYVFLILSAIAVLGGAYEVFTAKSGVSTIQSALDVVNATIDVIAFYFFAKYANEVRNDVLASK